MQYLQPAVHFLIKELFRQNAVFCHFESEDGTLGNAKLWQLCSMVDAIF
jgi:hypothetical protein